MADQEVRCGDLSDSLNRRWRDGMVSSGMDPALMIASNQDMTIRKAMIDAGNEAMEREPCATFDNGSFSTTLHWGKYISVSEQLNLITPFRWGDHGPTENLLSILPGLGNHGDWINSSAIANVLVMRRGNQVDTLSWLLKLLGIKSMLDFVPTNAPVGDFALQRINLEQRVTNGEDIQSIVRAGIGADVGGLEALWYFPRWRSSLLRRANGKSVRIWMLGYTATDDRHYPFSVMLERGGRIQNPPPYAIDFVDTVHYAPVILPER